MTALQSAPTHATRNGELLARLHDAKQAHGGFAQYRELLADDGINALVYEIINANQRWIAACVGKAKAKFGLRDSEEELHSLALTGPLGNGTEVRGVLGAILQYDFERFGTASFTPYLGKAIYNALMPRDGERREEDRTVPLPEDERVGKTKTWADRRQRQPRELAIDAELLGVMKEAIDALPERNRDVARYVVDYVQRTGERPTAQEVGQSRNPPVSKQMGDILMKQTMNLLKEKVEELYPQLAAEGVGGWAEFSKVFGIHKHAGVEP